jgi:hypothetical protein
MKTTRILYSLPFLLGLFGACAPRAVPSSFERSSAASSEAQEAPPARVNENLQKNGPSRPAEEGQDPDSAEEHHHGH